MGGAIYESKTDNNAATVDYTDRLQFIGHEEGRIRFKSENSSLQYDYMLKDHLGNVRMVLTEEQQTIYYPAATLEGTYSPTGAQVNSMVNHEKRFYSIDNTKVTLETSITSWSPPEETVANTKLYYNHNNIPPALPNPNYPIGVVPVQTTGSANLYKLNATSNKTGLEFIIKVMAGDKIDILGKSYFSNTGTVNNANSTLLDLFTLMTSLLTAPANGIGAKGLSASQLTTLNTGMVPSSFFRGANGETTTIPKAYINYIFLDEQFKFAGGSASRVGTNDQVKDHWITDAALLQNIPVPKNGYLFVYVSNESNFEVFFDNLQVIHKPGPILEETHYYPFGLTMAGISSQAAKGTDYAENKKGFNGNELQSKEFSDLSGLAWYDFNARTYDPQTGRFMQIDPLADEGEQESLSPYHFSENNPIRYNDPDGRCANCATAGIGAVVGGLIGGGIEIASQLYNNGSVSNWSAVGGAALQGVVTGAAAGFTGGASLFTTAAVSGGANVVGGAANRAIQGQGTTLTNVVTDATVGAVLGAGGKMVGNAVSNGTNNLSNSAKGKLGEAVTEIKYGAQGYKSAGNDVVKTGGKTVTGRQAEARFDHKMTNVFTGKKITVESKFNTSGFTKNQSTVIKNGYNVVVDRTTSNGLGNAANAATVGTGVGVDAQRNKRP